MFLLMFGRSVFGYALPMRCENCDGTGFVCEVHINRPWNCPRACGCGAAGMPCIICNGDGEKPDVSRVLKSVLQVAGTKVH